MEINFLLLLLLCLSFESTRRLKALAWSRKRYQKHKRTKNKTETKFLSTQFNAIFTVLHFISSMFDSLTKYAQNFRWISICFMIAKNFCSRCICIFPFACLFYFILFSAKALGCLTYSLSFAVVIRHVKLQKVQKTIFINILIRLPDRDMKAGDSWNRFMCSICINWRGFYFRSWSKWKVKPPRNVAWLSPLIINVG